MKIFDSKKEIDIDDDIYKAYKYREAGNPDLAFKYDERTGLLGGYKGIGYFAENFLYGHGVKKNRKLAYLLFDYMAKDVYKEHFEYAVALYYLGHFYCNGGYVKKDYKKALEYYQKSYEAGDFSALAMIGSMYIDGKGVKKDIEKGLSMYKKAGDEGNALGYVCLGLYYEKDAIKSKRNNEKALMYYQKAMLMEDSEGEKRYNNLLKKMKGGKKNGNK